MTRRYLGAPCADCGVGTFTLGEWYMVKDEVWDHAWVGRRKSWHALDGQDFLCIACLETRLGRTLMACDFTDVPINDPNQDNISERMRHRLSAKEGIMKGESIFDYLAKRMFKDMPPDEREAAWLLWKNKNDPNPRGV